MPRTRHAVIAVIALLTILVGLLIAVRVFAPNENEFEPLPAAAIFSQGAEGTVYAVTTLESSDTETVRASLIQKIEAQGHRYETEPVVETEVAPVVYEPVDPYVYATSTVEHEPIEEETETRAETADEEITTEE